MFKKVILISTLALSFGFFGCSSDESEIKNLALETCKKSAEKSIQNFGFYNKILNVEIDSVTKKESRMKGKEYYKVECKVTGILKGDNFGKKKGSEASNKKTLLIEEKDGKWVVTMIS